MQDIISKLRHIEELSNKDNYCEALKATESLLASYPYFIPMLIHKARLIQLLDEDCDAFDAYSPEDAKQALELATKLDPYSAEAFNELGHYVYAVEDNNTLGIKLFNKSIELGLHELEDAYWGKVGALEEIGTQDDCDKAVGDHRLVVDLLEQFHDESLGDQN